MPSRNLGPTVQALYTQGKDLGAYSGLWAVGFPWSCG